MKASQDIRPVTYLKTHSADLIREVAEIGRPMVITQNGTAKAVIIDIETYEKQKEMLLMLHVIARGEKQIEKGALRDQDEVFAKMEKELFS